MKREIIEKLTVLLTWNILPGALYLSELKLGVFDFLPGVFNLLYNEI